MKFKSQVYTQASGSVGGVTYSRNRGGMYTRSRTIPVNPNTARQTTARTNLAQAVNAWSNILVDPDRQAWTTYAQGTPVVDALGDQLILTGQQMFIKCTLPRLIAGLPIVAPGPITAGLATTPTITVDAELDSASNFTWTLNVAGAGADGDLIVYISEPVSPSRTVAHAKRAFAYLKTPPVADVFAVTVAANALPYDFSTYQQYRATAYYLSDDGRVSAAVIQDGSAI